MNFTDPGRDENAGKQSCLVLCDWGSSRLRAFLQSGGDIIARREGPGIGGLKGAVVETLREFLMPWQTSACFDRIVMCGMVGSRNGIAEVPYVQAPVGVEEWATHRLERTVEGLPLLIAAGVEGRNASNAPDVMRGEETQIFGAMSIAPALSRGHHTLLLPGTHSKCVQLVEGHIVSLQTYITGELYALLRDYSSLLRTGDADNEEEEGGFAEGLNRGQYAGLASSLFETRASQLTIGRSRGWARAFLSGLLIGDEVTRVVRAERPTDVVIIGEYGLASRYREALLAHAVRVDVYDADRCVIAGLRLLAGRTCKVAFA